MSQRVTQTSKQLAAQRQIDAAITHFEAGEFECAITLCCAGEGMLPEPLNSETLLQRLIRVGKESLSPDYPKDDFNYEANWLKHGNGPDEWDITELDVKLWLQRAISK